MCACTTLDCHAERRKFCEAEFFCYVENISSVVTRGCINEKTPLLCENRKPTKLGHLDYPHLFCCRDEDFCNSDVVPVKPTQQPGTQPTRFINLITSFRQYCNFKEQKPRCYYPRLLFYFMFRYVRFRN